MPSWRTHEITRLARVLAIVARQTDPGVNDGCCAGRWERPARATRTDVDGTYAPADNGSLREEEQPALCHSSRQRNGPLISALATRCDSFFGEQDDGLR
jgi:hypothetical protein